MGNDLTVEFVEGILSSCSYCGETEKIQLSIDRIDNKRGHLQDNVVPACVRCNIVRRDMPYEAWLMLAPAMKKAKEAGLLGDWLFRRLRHGKE